MWEFFKLAALLDMQLDSSVHLHVTSKVIDVFYSLCLSRRDQWIYGPGII